MSALFFPYLALLNNGREPSPCGRGWLRSSRVRGYARDNIVTPHPPRFIRHLFPQGEGSHTTAEARLALYAGGASCASA
jgi:hypothetical protein